MRFARSGAIGYRLNAGLSAPGQCLSVGQRVTSDPLAHAVDAAMMVAPIHAAIATLPRRSDARLPRGVRATKEVALSHHVRSLALLLALSPGLLLSPLAHAQGTEQVKQAPKPVDLDSVLAQAMAGTATPALGALVIREGKVAEHAVRGLRHNDRPEQVSLDDAWLIGSTAKPMTVALLARLVDKGVLSWDGTLAALLPDLARAMRPEYRTVTLKQLLSHRSGLAENLRDEKALDAFFTDARPLPVQRLALVRAALAEAPAAAPGSKFNYSNTGFLIAALIAERATGKHFEDLMQDEVFHPLGMTSAAFGPVPDSGIHGHRAGKPVGPMLKSDDGVPMVYTSAGNVHMGLQDWARFCLDQLAGSRSEGALLSPASYRLMQTAQPGNASGLDWGVQDSIGGRNGPVLVHGGSDGNWLAWVVLFPASRSGALVIANAADDMGADKATHAVVGAILPSLSTAK